VDAANVILDTIVAGQGEHKILLQDLSGVDDECVARLDALEAFNGPGGGLSSLLIPITTKTDQMVSWNYGNIGSINQNLSTASNVTFGEVTVTKVNLGDSYIEDGKVSLNDGVTDIALEAKDGRWLFSSDITVSHSIKIVNEDEFVTIAMTPTSVDLCSSHEFKVCSDVKTTGTFYGNDINITSIASWDRAAIAQINQGLNTGSDVHFNSVSATNFTVTGTTTTVNVTSLTTADATVVFANDNKSDVVDSGWLARYDTSGTGADPKFSGILRSAPTGWFHLVQGLSDPNLASFGLGGDWGPHADHCGMTMSRLRLVGDWNSIIMDAGPGKESKISWIGGSGNNYSLYMNDGVDGIILCEADESLNWLATKITLGDGIVVGGTTPSASFHATTGYKQPGLILQWDEAHPGTVFTQSENGDLRITSAGIVLLMSTIAGPWATFTNASITSTIYMGHGWITCSKIHLDDGGEGNWCQLEVSGTNTTITGSNPLSISGDLQVEGGNVLVVGDVTTNNLALAGGQLSSTGNVTVSPSGTAVATFSTTGEVLSGNLDITCSTGSGQLILRYDGTKYSYLRTDDSGVLEISTYGNRVKLACGLTVTSSVLFDEGSESVTNVYSSDSTGNYPYYNLLKKISTGTIMLNYHIIGKLQFAGYVTTGYARYGGNIECIATENWSESNSGCEVNISATKNGSTASTSMFKAGSDGYGHISVYDHNLGYHKLQRMETGIIDTTVASTPHTIYFNKVFSANPKVFIHGQAAAGGFGEYQTDYVTTSEVTFAWASVPGGSKLSWMAIGY
jgi:hypothetical protein